MEEVTCFGFTVRQGSNYDIDTYTSTPKPGYWNVHLPHQCDEWGITRMKSYEDENTVILGVPTEEAVASLEAFIAEAQAALAALKAGNEFGE